MKKIPQFMRVNDFIGWISALLIVIAYFLLSNQLADSKSLMYNGLNLIGGIGLAYRVWLDKNYSNFILEIIFILIALKSILWN